MVIFENSETRWSHRIGSRLKCSLYSIVRVTNHSGVTDGRGYCIVAVARRSFHESMHDSLGVQRFEVSVRLTRTDEDNRLSGNVRHRNGRTDLKKKSKGKNQRPINHR